jgi:hypothetical protein
MGPMGGGRLLRARGEGLQCNLCLVKMVHDPVHDVQLRQEATGVVDGWRLRELDLQLIALVRTL